MLCVDASVVVEALIGWGELGDWAERVLPGAHLVAPQLLLVEAANIVRRLEGHGKLSTVGAERTFARLRALPVSVVPFEACAQRVWELRHNLTCYDAWYVAVAELHDVPLVTLDLRLASAPGPRCEFLTPAE